MNSPIAWVGGKRLLRKEIIKRFPQHTAYVEVFCGAAWVLFAKDPAISEVEIINDLNDELANFWRCVREQPFELAAKLEFALVCKSDFQQARAQLYERTGNELERAARFFFVLKTAFGSRTSRRATFGYALTNGSRPRLNHKHFTEMLRAAHERLAQVYVFNEDFEALIGRSDRASTFYYCDPPYYDCKGCYEHEFSDAEHERLAKALKRINGKFLLSYNDAPKIQELYSWAKIEDVATNYTLGKANKWNTKSKELLISNY